MQTIIDLQHLARDGGNETDHDRQRSDNYSLNSLLLRISGAQAQPRVASYSRKLAGAPTLMDLIARPVT